MKRNQILALAVVLLASTVAVAQETAPVAGSKIQTVSLVKKSTCPPAAQPECCVYEPCVTYKHCGRCCNSCSPMVKQVLLVNDPCDCCSVAKVPVCLPACCTKACISTKCGLFGRRGVVTYEYDCGVCVTFTFRKCGDVVVTYRGC